MFRLFFMGLALINKDKIVVDGQRCGEQCEAIMSGKQRLDLRQVVSCQDGRCHDPNGISVVTCNESGRGLTDSFPAQWLNRSESQECNKVWGDCLHMPDDTRYLSEVIGITMGYPILLLQRLASFHGFPNETFNQFVIDSPFEIIFQQSACCMTEEASHLCSALLQEADKKFYNILRKRQHEFLCNLIGTEDWDWQSDWDWRQTRKLSSYLPVDYRGLLEFAKSCLPSSKFFLLNSIAMAAHRCIMPSHNKYGLPSDVYFIVVNANVTAEDIARIIRAHPGKLVQDIHGDKKKLYLIDDKNDTRHFLPTDNIWCAYEPVDSGKNNFWIYGGGGAAILIVSGIAVLICKKKVCSQQVELRAFEPQLDSEETLTTQ